MKNKIEVFLNDQYGYRTYTWTLSLSEQEFVDWWKNLTDSDIIKYYFNIKSLPGKLKRNNPAIIGDAKVRVQGDPRDKTPHLYCHLHDVHDSFVCVGDEKIPHTRTNKRDWKDLWIDYQIKKQADEPIEI